MENRISTRYRNRWAWFLSAFVMVFASWIPHKAIAAICIELPLVVVKTLNSPASITINPYVAVGTVLSTSTFTGNSGQFTITCVGLFSQFIYQGVGTPTNNIYPSNIPGIGIQLSNASGTTGNWPVTETFTPAVLIYTGSSSVDTNFSLIKTGPITAGGTLAANVGSFILPQQGNFVGFQINLASPMVINLTQSTCSVTSPTISVPLGAFPVSYFPSVGSKSSPIPFNIQVTCAGGLNGTLTQMSVTLTDASGNGVGNTGNTLALSSSSTASGIGVQIMYNGVVRSFGPDSSAAGNTNQFLLTSGSNGVYNFPFYAYMIRTGTVSAGSVITTATFTMNYQ